MRTRTIGDLFRQYEVEATSVEDFMDRYYKAERYIGRGEVYALLLLQSYKNELRDKGFTFISQHDSITGRIVSYYGDTMVRGGGEPAENPPN